MIETQEHISLVWEEETVIYRTYQKLFTKLRNVAFVLKYPSGLGRSVQVDIDQITITLAMVLLYRI